MKIMVYLIQETLLWTMLKVSIYSGLIVMIMFHLRLLSYYSIIQKSMTQSMLFANTKEEMRMIINLLETNLKYRLFHH